MSNIKKLIFLILIMPLSLLAPPRPKEDPTEKSGELVTPPVKKFEELPADLLDEIVQFLGLGLSLRQLSGACKKFRCWAIGCFPPHTPGRFIRELETPLALPPPQIAEENLAEKFGIKITHKKIDFIENGTQKTIWLGHFLGFSPDGKKAAIFHQRDLGLGKGTIPFQTIILELDPDTELIKGSIFNIDVPKIDQHSCNIIQNLHMLERLAWSPDSSKLAIIIRGNQCKELCILSAKHGETSAFFNRIHINTDELGFKLRDPWYKPKNKPVSEYTQRLVEYPNCNSSLAFTPDGQSLVVGHSVGIYDALEIGGEGITLGYYKRKMGLERNTPFENWLTLIQYFNVNSNDLSPLQILIPEKFELELKLNYDEDGKLVISDGSGKQCAILPMEVFEDSKVSSRFDVSRKSIIGIAAVLGLVGFSAFVVSKILKKNEQKRKKRQRKIANAKAKIQPLIN